MALVKKAASATTLIPTRYRLVLWVVFLAPFAAWSSVFASCALHEYRHRNRVNDLSSIRWMKDGKPLTVSLTIENHGERGDFKIAVTDDGGDTIYSCSVGAYRYIWKTDGFVKAVQADDDDDLEILICGSTLLCRTCDSRDCPPREVPKEFFAKRPRGGFSFVLDWNGREVREVPLKRARGDVDAVLEDWNTLNGKWHRTISGLVLLILGYLTLGVLLLIGWWMLKKRPGHSEVDQS